MGLFPLTLGNIWKLFCCSTGNCKLLIALSLPRCTSEYTVERDHLNARLAIRASRSWLTSRSTIWYIREKNPTSVRYVTQRERWFLQRPKGWQGFAHPLQCAGRAEGQTLGCSGPESAPQPGPALVQQRLWDSTIACSLLEQHLPDTVLPSSTLKMTFSNI